jgi:pSer/pThr/pTyr-binding forkhead associated (FHA) protein
MERGTQLFGSPITPRHARLCQRTVEGVTRDVFHLSKDETTIGRELGDIVFSSDPFMSRRHASIVRDPQTKAFTAKDLGSSNGTYLAIRGEVEVTHGDHIRIGQHLFRFEIQ